MRRLSVRMGRNFSPARKVLSSTAPSWVRRSLVRTKAPPLPGLTCWNSTILKTVPSTSMWVPFLNWLVLITGARLAAGGAALPPPPGRRRQHAPGKGARRARPDVPAGGAPGAPPGGARRSRLDVPAEVAPVAQQRDARRDHVVGGVQPLAPEDARVDPGVDPVELRRQPFEQLALGLRIDVEDEAAEERRPEAAGPG